MLQIHKYFDGTSGFGMSIGSTCSEQGVNLQVTRRHRSILVNLRMSVKPLLCYKSRRHSRHYYSSAFQYTVIYTFHWMRTGGTTRRRSYRRQTHLVTSHIAHTQIKQWLQRSDNCISAECILSHYHRTDNTWKPGSKSDSNCYTRLEQYREELWDCARRTAPTHVNGVWMLFLVLLQWQQVDSVNECVTSNQLVFFFFEHQIGNSTPFTQRQF